MPPVIKVIAKARIKRGNNETANSKEKAQLIVRVLL